jgi:deoxyribodipyrimidine photo-lyase
MLTQVVWFKRDLRLQDHAALNAAAARGPVLPIVIVEPEYWRLPDTSRRQWQFWRGCIADLEQSIRAECGGLVIRLGDVVAVLDELRAQLGAFVLHSHEETGNAWTFQRDLAVKRWCKAHTIEWAQYRQFGVWRRPRVNRDRWSSGWDRMMAEPTLACSPQINWVKIASDLLPDAEERGLIDDGLQVAPKPGRDAAETALYTFLHQRGEHYTRQMSSPITAQAACSRLSAHLAYGSISVREITQAAWARYRELPADEKAWRQSLRSFIARLHWHCHFIQKLESEPQAEFRSFARVYDGMRPQPGNVSYLAAWDLGQTGYPFIDAAMRYLNATGWINFRMRAMLMSFACYDLWLPWQEAGMALARKFIDYEPGIHWPQAQMQAGETGINTVRIYSPVKQGFDQDPAGEFVTSWVPELRNVPASFIHEPWRLPAENRAALCPDYPERLVDHSAAAKAAKITIYALRRQPAARAEAKAVVIKHGSRKRSRDRIAKAKAYPAQLAFDLDA